MQMMFEENRDGNLKKKGKSHGEINVWTGVKLVDRKNDEELMKMLCLKETFDKMAKVNEILWYERVVRRDDDNVPKKALMLEVNG